MSIFYPDANENFDTFLRILRQYKTSITNIFKEIYFYLGNKEFISRKEFKEKYISALSKENNNEKILKCGLILRTSLDDNKLELTDRNSTFVISINFLKIVPVVNRENNIEKKNYLFNDCLASLPRQCGC
mgnify:FL=1